MTTITINRATVEQALEALEAFLSDELRPYEAAKTSDALRAALAQQAEPVEPVACGDLEERKALSSVKLPCDVRIGHGTHRKGSSLLALVVRSRSLYQMAKSGDYYGYAVRLAVAIWEKHYKDTAPHWKPLDDLMGVLTQIDNMTSGLTRLAQQAEPVEPVAYIHRQGNHWEVSERHLDEDEKARGWTEEPLYTSPPQQAEPQPTTGMDKIHRLRAERDALADRLREVRAQLTDTTEAALNAWAADRLARHGILIPMPEGDPK